MPALAPLVIKDRAATPVDHTFNPRDTSNGVVTLAESTGVPLGERRITLGQNRAPKTNRTRAILRYVIPVVQDEVINSITRPVVVRTNYAEVVFNFDPGSSVQERKDLVGFVENTLKSAQTMVNAFVVDLEGLY